VAHAAAHFRLAPFGTRSGHYYGEGIIGVTVTMRYTHSNLASKVAAMGKLTRAATNLLHLAPKCSSSNPKCSKLAGNSQNTLELKREEWVSG
jgi:hypothetical protein